eukprot:7255986-Prymnesium_polylepis.1
MAAAAFQLRSPVKRLRRCAARDAAARALRAAKSAYKAHGDHPSPCASLIAARLTGQLAHCVYSPSA